MISVGGHNVSRLISVGFARSFFVLLLFYLSGCASYDGRIRKGRGLFDAGLYTEAVSELEPLAAQEGRDQLLFLMDLGLAQFSAGEYEAAIKSFLKADTLAEIKDYTSITEEAASVVLHDEVKPYKGEDFEKILINTYLAMSFAFLKKWDSSLVECRKVNHKLDLMRREGKLPYKKNAFAKYLAALLFEARGEINDAFVDYRQLAAWKMGVPYLGAPLLRLAKRLGAQQEYRTYKRQFPATRNYRIRKGQGEIVMLLEQGRGPVKVPTPGFRLLPMFQRRHNAYEYGVLRLGAQKSRAGVQTRVMFDIEKTAIEQHEAKKAAMMAKKIGGVVVKEVLAHQVEKATKSKLAGALTSLFLHLTDRADLRSWSTLPASLQVARIIVPAGRHEVVLDMVDRSGARIEGVKRWQEVNVKPGEKVFLNYRSRS